MGWAVLLASVLGVASTWLGILLAYDSYSWGSARNGWPVSFFIVAIVFVGYLLARLSPVRRRSSSSRTSRSRSSARAASEL
jgi:zinc/manganese transport system permease protein